MVSRPHPLLCVWLTIPISLSSIKYTNCFREFDMNLNKSTRLIQFKFKHLQNKLRPLKPTVYRLPAASRVVFSLHNATAAARILARRRPTNGSIQCTTYVHLLSPRQSGYILTRPNSTQHNLSLHLSDK